MEQTVDAVWYKDKFPYKIGGTYSYFRDKKTFVLESVDAIRGVFSFRCGHRCTDSVFEDLVDLETGIQGYQYTWASQPVQLPLF